jgi:hypothetical protein
MFVKNKSSIDFNYRKNGYLAVLKAGTVSYVDENIVSARDLISCYGQRIDVISLDDIETPALKKEHTKKPAEVKKVAEKKPSIIKKEELDESFIEKVLGEIEEENKAPDLKDELVKILEANNAVADFLEGKTDELPEGTEIITNEEAEKLENKEIKKEENNEDKTSKAPQGNKTPKAAKTGTKTRRGRTKKS